jgi:hypothetical protein
MGSFAGGEQSATQPPSRLQLAKSPPDEEPEEELLDELEEELVEDPDELLDELEEELDEDPDELLELVELDVDPPQLAAVTEMLPALKEASESVE